MTREGFYGADRGEVLASMYHMMYIERVGETDLTSWDDLKREGNIRKHAYDFPAVEEVFDGRFCLVRPDTRKDYGEPRYNMLVYYRGSIVNVTFTPREEKYHLISVRPASRKERNAFHAKQASG